LMAGSDSRNRRKIPCLVRRDKDGVLTRIEVGDNILAFIVRCVNAHDPLVEALHDLLDNPVVSGISARIRDEANERAVPDAYAAAEAAIKEAGAE